MREKHHEGHQHDEVDEALPFASGGAENLSEASHLMLLPCFGLRHFHSNVEGQQSRQGADPEHGAPSPDWQEKPRGNGREQIANGIATLQNSTEDSAPAHRCRFHGKRSTHSPLAAHADAEECAQNKEYREVGRKAAQKLDEREINHVGHERNAPPIAIGKQTEEQGAHGARGESDRGSENDFFLGYAKLMREGIKEKYNDEEVEGVERPTEESGERSMMRT